MDKEQILYELTVVKLEIVRAEATGIKVSDGMFAIQQVLEYEKLKAKEHMLKYQLSYINHKERME